MKFSFASVTKDILGEQEFLDVWKQEVIYLKATIYCGSKFSCFSQLFSQFSRFSQTTMIMIMIKIMIMTTMMMMMMIMMITIIISSSSSSSSYYYYYYYCLAIREVQLPW